MDYFNINGEIWKPIVNDRYLISNNGHLASFRYSTKKHKRIFKRMKMHANTDKRSRKKVGYYDAMLSYGHRHYKHFYIHRLVAKAFIPNPHHYPTVNHIDGNHFNNHVDNLEWCTYSRNNKLAFDTNLHPSLKDNPKVCNKVIAYLPNGKLRYRFNSMRDAERKLHLSNGTVHMAIKKHWLYGDLFWSKHLIKPKKVRYLIRYFKNKHKIHHFTKRMKPVNQYTKSGKYMKTYRSCTYAAKCIDGYESSINRCLHGQLKTYKGFIWKYNK